MSEYWSPDLGRLEGIDPKVTCYAGSIASGCVCWRRARHDGFHACPGSASHAMHTWFPSKGGDSPIPRCGVS